MRHTILPNSVVVSVGVEHMQVAHLWVRIFERQVGLDKLLTLRTWPS